MLNTYIYHHYGPKHSRIQWTHTECFTTCGHYWRRWFPRYLW